MTQSTPSDSPAPVESQRTPVWFVGLLLLSTLLACVPMIWPAVDLAAASLFATPDAPLHHIDWWWVAAINDYVPSVFRYLLLLAAIGWGLTWLQPQFAGWRFALAFFVIAGVIGPGAVVNWGLKDNWQRARPYHVTEFGGKKQFSRAGVMTDQCEINCSFVSGHVSCGIFLASLALVQRRRQVFWTLFGGGFGLLIGFSRMAPMAHWLSDVLWAYPITLVSAWLVWRAMRWFDSRPVRTLG